LRELSFARAITKTRPQVTRKAQTNQPSIFTVFKSKLPARPLDKMDHESWAVLNVFDLRA
jgi:hypothetical protein